MQCRQQLWRQADPVDVERAGQAGELGDSGEPAVPSAAVIGPRSRAMTTRTGVSFTPWNGVASRAAWRLGLPAGRELALFCLATLASEGRNKVARTAATTQAATIGQRKRTANRPVAAKNLCMGISPCGCGGAGGRWRGVEAEDLMTAQRLKEWLEAPADQAPQRGAIGLHVADTGRTRYPAGGSGADETDLYSPYRQLLSHVFDARKARPGRHR